MKMILALVATMVLGSTASALTVDVSMPDFNMTTRYEKNVIGADQGVIAYAQALGAKTFWVTNGKPAPRMYAVTTNNGCTFDVEVVYVNWPGVDDVVVYQATCGK